MKKILILVFMIFCSNLIWAAPSTPLQKLVMRFSYDPDKRTYQSDYELINRKNNQVLNNGLFQGCTYGGVIQDIKRYLNERKFIRVTPINKGFAIHYLQGCGAQTVWRLIVVTSRCVASLPATDSNGNAIEIGADSHKIKFGTLTGVGAARKVTFDYLVLKEDGTIQLSAEQDAMDAVSLSCHVS